MSIKMMIKNPETKLEYYVVEVSELGKVVGVPFVTNSIEEMAILVEPFEIFLADLDDAVKSMKEYEHNTAHFGSLGSFMFSTYEGRVS
jgi:hypothetical protein